MKFALDLATGVVWSAVAILLAYMIVAYSHLLLPWMAP